MNKTVPIIFIKWNFAMLAVKDLDPNTLSNHLIPFQEI